MEKFLKIVLSVIFVLIVAICSSKFSKVANEKI